MQFCTPRAWNPGNVLLTCRNSQNYFYQCRVLRTNRTSSIFFPQWNAHMSTKRATFLQNLVGTNPNCLHMIHRAWMGWLKEKHKHKAQVFSHKSHKNDRKKGEETKKHAWINTNANQCTMWAKLFLQENPYFF